MRIGAPFRNRNYPDPSPRTPESEVEPLRRRVERLETRLARLEGDRDADEPVMRRVRWEYGDARLALGLVLVAAILVWRFGCAR